MLTDIQQKRLHRLIHLKEFAPCTTVTYDYELQQKGYVKIIKETFKGEEFISTELTAIGLQHVNHLSEENKI